MVLSFDGLQEGPSEGQKTDTRGGGSEWEPIKILLEGFSNKTNMAYPTHVQLKLPKFAKVT
jgi:hypothetical protein